ncbi:caveolin-1-like [Lineus longissimus]|uniref:caveolin-1-like n=1 Tax=Lineus longissimus TaxID=88925 RepID=UPI002B4DE3EC
MSQSGSIEEIKDIKEIPSTSIDPVTDKIDMINRDPNNINGHLTVSFEDVFGEPDHAHSIDCVWRNSYKCFTCTKSCCYMVLTTLCSIITAFCWACEFAVVTFTHVWAVAPCFKWIEMNMLCCKRFYGIWIHCLCDPVWEACGMMFAAFKK